MDRLETRIYINHLENRIFKLENRVCEIEAERDASKQIQSEEKKILIAEIEKNTALIVENEALKTELKLWQSETSKEMPPDFKDWWQNSKKEWPIVVRIVLENRRERLEEIEKILYDGLSGLRISKAAK